jgi:hypothetical protein
MKSRKKEKVKMIFEVVVDKDFMIDDETLTKEYKNDIHKVAKELYKQEGAWWDGQMELIETKFIT